MSTMKVKTAELTGQALDWAVAKVLGWHMIPVPPDYDGDNPGEVIAPPIIKPGEWIFPPKGRIPAGYFLERCSSDWMHGGPLIDMYKVEVFFSGDTAFCKLSGLAGAAGFGRTPLIAACRAIVSAKLGDEVEVPAELVEEESC